MVKDFSPLPLFLTEMNSKFSPAPKNKVTQNDLAYLTQNSKQLFSQVQGHTSVIPATQEAKMQDQMSQCVQGQRWFSLLRGAHACASTGVSFSN